MYYDLLPRIKNAVQRKKESILVPFSKFDFAVLRVLVDTKYLEDAQKKSVGKRTMIEIKLRYANGQPVLSDFKLISKPSRRQYAGADALRSVKQGYGISIISTPSGVMSGASARKKNVGGEYLFQVW
ncbi:MAG: 30S ribosomal protein S8 [Candidatus Liptonbacteria bacterium RIFCSPLOWO2_01_FULL_53_13]|uniref:Small ribosomal subunit protein uS8 n=1 Tax=Candidatus Liptonbacteria bacterium RIFCSPLOWO2_01_FULL_53_13 TaxID=1798651 RepID=A0A1G2CMC7_9BACT|nr:MAG: 30S ribosomal protein S8 [Candidatus Liptonbacteria bacterium RIFCSPLOWO2_01_FULL_53_13]